MGIWNKVRQMASNPFSVNTLKGAIMPNTTWDSLNTAQEQIDAKEQQAADLVTAIDAPAPDGTLSEWAATIDPRGTMANVLRGMSDDFFSTAIPVKNDLIEMTTYNGNKGVVDDLKTQGMAQTAQSFTNAAATAGRNVARYGMKQTVEQQAAQSSALSSGKALAEVDSLNRATQYQNDLNKQLVSGMSSPAGITK
jgi:hypothetical protein